MKGFIRAHLLTGGEEIFIAKSHIEALLYFGGTTCVNVMGEGQYYRVRETVQQIMDMFGAED